MIFSREDNALEKYNAKPDKTQEASVEKTQK